MAYESDRERIARELREDINSGRLAPGAQIPSAARLAHRYNVSERTVQEAMRSLRDEGLVYGRRGRGVFVGQAADEPGPHPNLRAIVEEQDRRLTELERWRAEVEQQGHAEP